MFEFNELMLEIVNWMFIVFGGLFALMAIQWLGRTANWLGSWVDSTVRPVVIDMENSPFAPAIHAILQGVDDFSETDNPTFLAYLAVLYKVLPVTEKYVTPTMIKETVDALIEGYNSLHSE